MYVAGPSHPDSGNINITIKPVQANYVAKMLAGVKF